MGRVWREEEG
jgi:hypothetical protein